MALVGDKQNSKTNCFLVESQELFGMNYITANARTADMFHRGRMPCFNLRARADSR